MHEYDIVIGVDVGGTKIEAALIRFLNGQELDVKKRVRRPTDREKGADHIIKVIAELCQDVVLETPGGLKAVVGIGLGLPGTVHPLDNLMVNGNTQVLIGVDVRSKLQKILNFDGHINIANDANCFALAETLYGVGLIESKRTNLPLKSLVGLGIILGTGVGGGLILQGKIFEGANGVASEIGHSYLATHEQDCYCGGNGHAEQFLSGKAIEESFYLMTQKKMHADQIFDLLISKGEHFTQAQKCIKQYKELLAKLIANLCNLYDPHFIVLGGGVSLQKEIYQNLQEVVTQKIFYKNAKFKIYQHALGDSSGVIGAALLA